MKQYPLDVQPLNENEGDWLGWYTKGHHPPDSFRSAVLDREGAAASERIGPVRQETWRVVPDTLAGDGWMALIPAQPGRRGAFPVTVADRVARRRS